MQKVKNTVAQVDTFFWHYFWTVKNKTKSVAFLYYNILMLIYSRLVLVNGTFFNTSIFFY